MLVRGISDVEHDTAAALSTRTARSPDCADWQFASIPALCVPRCRRWAMVGMN